MLLLFSWHHLVTVRFEFRLVVSLHFFVVVVAAIVEFKNSLCLHESMCVKYSYNKCSLLTLTTVIE